MYQLLVNQINKYYVSAKNEEVDGSAVSALQRAIADVKLVSHWSVTKNLLSRVPSCFGRHVMPLFPTTFAVVSTHQPALGAWWVSCPFSLCVIHEEDLCPSSGDINRLMVMK
jgi:hypothetical protein